MESFKANFIILIFIALALGLGYWAFASLNETNSSLIENADLPDVGPMVTSGPGVPVTPEVVTPEPEPTPVTNPEPETPVVTPADDLPAQAGDAALISELQKLISDKILMKKGSRGTRVGTIQKFLNEYGIKVPVDNDYGDTTVNAVKKFQTEQKLSADGQSGETTYQKMIEWLKEN